MTPTDSPRGEFHPAAPVSPSSQSRLTRSRHPSYDGPDCKVNRPRPARRNFRLAYPDTPPDWVGPFDGPESWPRSTDCRIEQLGFSLPDAEGGGR